MSRKTRNSRSSGDHTIVFVGGASEDLSDTLKSFIEEWLVPTLVEEYIRLHKVDSSGHFVENMEAGTQDSSTRCVQPFFAK